MPGSRKKIITEKKRFPIWIPIAAAVVIIAAGAGIVIYGRKRKHADADK